ncbi:MAG: dienelactone hydrolase family protein [Candidatus Velthaea sp.]
MQSQSVSLDVGGSAMPCYLARPDGEGPKPAVIVLQEIFGVNTEVKRITDLLASSGYVGFAINYYHRTHPELNVPYTQEGLQAGFAAAGQVSRATLRADVSAAMDYLNAQDFVANNHIATWGFCFGGSVAFVTATLPGLSAAIAFYGGSIAGPFPNGEPEGLADVAQVRAPLLLAFGGKDAYIPAEAVERTRKALTDAKKHFQIQVYPDQDHAFFRDSSAVLDSSKDVADAWDLVQAFLKEHLK